MSLIPFIFACALIGFLALAAAMPRHWRQFAIARSCPALALRLAAGAALLAALSTCTVIWNPARAIPLAIGLGSIAAITSALLLSFASRTGMIVVVFLLVLGAGASALLS